MNANTTEKMRKMKFYGMLHAFKMNLEAGRSEQYTPDEMVAHLIEAEWENRHNRSIDRQLKNARFRYKAAIEDVFYHTDRNTPPNSSLN
jgi:hypothetical protein